MQARLSALVVCLALAGCAGPTLDESISEPFHIPRLQVEGMATSPAHAAQIEKIDPRRLAVAMQLLGLQESGDPIYLVLAPEDSLAASRTPGWIAGYAFSDKDVAVLFPDRTPTYPDSNFEELVLHEVGHILVSRASGGAELPRWFNEGLALFIGRPWRLEDHSRVTWALVSRANITLADLEDHFNSNRAAAAHAYALAGAFVHDLLQRHGSGVAAFVLAAVATGSRFEDAFRDATGVSLEEAEASFWGRHTFIYRWVPVLTSSATLWIAISLLALVAFKRRRTRDAALRERWEQEDRAADNDSG